VKSCLTTKQSYYYTAVYFPALLICFCFSGSGCVLFEKDTNVNRFRCCGNETGNLSVGIKISS